MPDEIGLFEAIYSQRAIRKLKPDPVSDEFVHRLIEAATKAPSLGYPIGRYGPTTRRPLEEVRHHERWDKAKT